MIRHDESLDMLWLIGGVMRGCVLRGCVLGASWWERVGGIELCLGRWWWEVVTVKVVMRERC